MFESSEIDLFEQSTNLDGQFSLAKLTLEQERDRHTEMDVAQLVHSGI